MRREFFAPALVTAVFVTVWTISAAGLERRPSLNRGISRHPLEKVFFPLEREKSKAVDIGEQSRLRKRDAVDEDEIGRSPTSTAKKTPVFFDAGPAGLDSKGADATETGGSLKFNNPKLLDSLGIQSLEESYKEIHQQESEEQERQFLGGIVIEDAARHLGSFMRKISNDELRVTQMQSIFDSLSYSSTESSIADRLAHIVRQLGLKLRRYAGILAANQAAVQELYTSYLWDRSGQIYSGFSPFGVTSSIGEAPKDCCRLRRNSDVVWSDAWQTHISTAQSCDLVSSYAIDEPLFSPGRNLTHVFGQNLRCHPMIKWQYFISMQGLHVEYPAHNFDASRVACDEAVHARHRDVFVATVMPRRKNVVVVLDQGHSLSPNQMAIAKAVAHHVLSSLSEEDYVGVIGLADKPEFPPAACMSEGLVPMTYETRYQLDRFIGGLRKVNAPTNHAMGFRKAFEMIWRSLGLGNATEDPDEALIIYISRGLLSSLADAKDIISTIALENGRMGHRVVINTYAVIDQSTPLMFEKSFLLDIAEQNFSKYAVMKQHPAPVRKGFMVAVNSTENIHAEVGDFWKVLWRPGEGDVPPSGTNRGTGGLGAIPRSWWPGNNDDADSAVSGRTADSSIKMRFSLPHVDSEGGSGGLIVSLSKPAYYNKHVIGMVGLDVHLGDLMADLTYYSELTSPPTTSPLGSKKIEKIAPSMVPLSYAFLVELNGLALAHPTFSRPSEMTDQPMHTDISHFEKVDGFHEARRKILSLDTGEHFLRTYSNKTGGSSSDGKKDNTKKIYVVHYAWQRISNSPYIIVIRTDSLIDIESDPSGGLNVVKQTATSSNRGGGSLEILNLMYHRLDLLPPDRSKDRLCTYLKQIATFSTSTMYLSPNAFIKPFEHLKETETWTMVQGYTAWLRDKTGLLSNPGIRPEVRPDAIALSKINGDWMQAYHHSPLKDHIVRRYVATPTGVLRMFPGTLLSKRYNPLEQRWYTRALKHPGQVVFTGPYLDVGGAGYVVTLSHTIYEGRSASLHSASDPVVAVMGLDFTLHYFYKHLQELFPFLCKHSSSIRCFILDDSGYLIAHQGLIDPNGKGPVEQQHITHKEPLVANDILNHRWFVKKQLCNSYNDRTIQRFYKFNTSHDGVLTNLVHGEHCAKYQVTHIQGTNSFLGMINQTCSMITAFCPCSMMDRLCLNCHRMEQNECECPCECPLEMDYCTGDILKRENSNAPCSRFPSSPFLATPSISSSSNLYWKSTPLPQCNPRECQTRLSKDDCFAVLDCEWCEIESDGSQIESPFCASQRICFGGVRGARTPYRDEISSSLPKSGLGEPGGASPSTGVGHRAFPGVRSAPVGPVAGGIMGCFLVLAIAVYCYRHHVVQSRYAHAYLSAQMGNGSSDLRMNALEELPPDMEGPVGDGDGDPPSGGIGNTNFVLATFENPMAAAAMSPYRVNTSPRRPLGGESDYGYSTMTPHEDTDQQSQADTVTGSRERYHPSLAIPRPSSGGQPRITCNPQLAVLPSPYAAVPASPIPPPPATPSVSSLSTSTSPMDGVLTSKDLVYSLQQPSGVASSAESAGCPSISKDSGIGPYTLPPQLKQKYARQSEAGRERSDVKPKNDSLRDGNAFETITDPSVTVISNVSESWNKVLADVTVHPEPS